MFYSEENGNQCLTIHPRHTSELLDIFRYLFPNLEVDRYWPKGFGAIRIRRKQTYISNQGQKVKAAVPIPDLVFTFYSSTEWKLETLEIYNRSKDGI